MPRKPTQPFGHLAFSKSGRVKKEMQLLSDVKEAQELQVAASFVEAYNRLALGSAISNLKSLDENDHDASALLNGLPLEFQVTELVERSYTIEMTKEEYDAGVFTEAVQLNYGARPRRVDQALRDEALWRAIDKKLAKSYARPADGSLRLLVFSVGALYPTEYISGGVFMVSPALALARRELATSGIAPFTAVWFTNLQTRPVRVWPCST